MPNVTPRIAGGSRETAELRRKIVGEVVDSETLRKSLTTEELAGIGVGTGVGDDEPEAELPTAHAEKFVEVDVTRSIAWPTGDGGGGGGGRLSTIAEGEESS